MTRGLLSGLLWGGVMCLGAAVALSTLVPLPSPRPMPVLEDAPAPEGAAVEPEAAPSAAPDVAVVETAPEDAAVEPAPAPVLVPEPAPSAAPETSVIAEVAEAEAAPELPDVAAAPAVEAAPVLPAPQAAAPVQEVASAPAARPQTGTAETLETPAAPEEDSPVALAQETAVFPTPQALAPMAPPPADDVSVATEPAPLPVPEKIVAVPEAEVEAEVEAEDEGAPVVAAPVVVTPAPQSESAALTPEAPQRPRIGTPASTLTDRDTGVRVNRAPVGAEGEDAPEASGASEAAEAQSAAPETPFSKYAKPFENPEGKPLMSIVLIDDGADLRAPQGGLAALRRFPYPVSFAINANLPDANARMDAYRAEGFEVLAMVDLPQGAVPSDAEVTLSAALDALPETVAVLEGVAGGLQPNRETADQVTAILAQSGHGLVAQPQGLNTMPKLAVKAGVPAAPVFRDFDSSGQSATVIRRFLDQAAFKASQEGGVIMLGRIRPETIQALLVWALADRAGKVALVPVSAVLSGQ